ncbi:MAG TPA: alpha/beta fold hydrolase [Flavobacteriales bacterium]|nr:alpha/beta fold hydrolase [Flavobacteriales bacterium]
MKKIILLAGIACGFTQTLSAQMTNETMTVGAATRQYRQYIPTGFDSSTEPGLPLVIAMHGLGDTYIGFSAVDFQSVADTARFILVYPNGTLNSWGQNSWNNGTLLSSTSDDYTFLSRIIDTMYTRHNIDLAKVYVCGFSMGGIMTYHTLCAMPERIAAIASVAGPMSTPDFSSCNPGRAVPVMHVHGTLDGTIAYSGSPLPTLTLPTATVAFWQDNNGCTDSTVTNLPDLVPGDTVTVERIDYNMCSEPVQLWRENNADHVWLYTPANDIDVTSEIWRFFYGKTHPAPSMIGIAENSQTVELNLATTPTGISIASSKNMHEIFITDMQGRTIFSSKENVGRTHEISLNNFQNQVLVVGVKCGNHYKMQKFGWTKQ